jgi:hypothetical protein
MSVSDLSGEVVVDAAKKRAVQRLDAIERKGLETYN